MTWCAQREREAHLRGGEHDHLVITTGPAAGWSMVVAGKHLGDDVDAGHARTAALGGGRGRPDPSRPACRAAVVSLPKIGAPDQSLTLVTRTRNLVQVLPTVLN